MKKKLFIGIMTYSVTLAGLLYLFPLPPDEPTAIEGAAAAATRPAEKVAPKSTPRLAIPSAFRR